MNALRSKHSQIYLSIATKIKNNKMILVASQILIIIEFRIFDNSIIR